MAWPLISDDEKLEGTVFDFANSESHTSNLMNGIAEPRSAPAFVQSYMENSHWPRSYQRSMSLYSCSSPPLAGPNFFFNASKNSLPINTTASSSQKGINRQILFSSSYTNYISQLHIKTPLLHDSLQGEEDMPILHAYTPYPRLLSLSDANSESMYQVSESNEPNRQQSSFFQATLNAVNALAGVGVLSMPYAVAEGGWIGLFILLIFAVVCCYTGILLLRCIDLDPKIQSYPDVGQAAFGKFGRLIISCMLYLELFCAAIEYLILEGDNLTQLFSWNGLNMGFLQLDSEKSFVLIAAALMLPTVWLRDLSLLSYISVGGVIACITLLITIVWSSIFETGLTPQGQVINLKGFPIAVGMYAFCYSGHAVFPCIYGSMKEKNKFSHVLILSFVVCTLIYGVMAVMGFLMFGDSIQSQVTLNLARGQAATKVALVATILNPFAKYALTLTPVAAGLEECLPDTWKSRNVLMWGTVMRTLLVASTVVIALAIPFFAYIMSLIGSFLCTTMAITIPCMCYLKLFSHRISYVEAILMVFFLAIGITSCVAGTYSSILELVTSFLN